MDERREAATFDVQRVAGGPRRAGAFTVIAAGLGALGLVTTGLVLAASPPRPPAAAAAPALPMATAMVDAATPRTTPPTVRGPESESRPSRWLHTRAWGSYVLVHGDVSRLAAVVVIVSIRDRNGSVIDVRTIDVDRPSRGGAASDARFQLAFQVDGTAAAWVASVEANVYGRAGLPIASDRQALTPPVDAGWWRSEGQ